MNLIFSHCLALTLLAATSLCAAEPKPPKVNAGADKVVLGEQKVDLLGKASDKDTNTKKNPLKVKWTQLSGPAEASLSRPRSKYTVVDNLQLGTYVFQLEATDSQGLSTVDSATIEVLPTPAPGLFIPPLDPNILYSGRRLVKNDTQVDLGFSGAMAVIRFADSPFIRARLKAVKDKGAPSQAWAILDGDVDNARIVWVDSRSDYLLFDNIAPGEHTLQLVRLSGAWKSAIGFRGFELAEDARLLPPPERPERRVEFQGDSITEGTYWPDPPGVNAYLAYAMTTGRLLDAESHLIAKSGIGLVRGFTLPQTLTSMLTRSVPWDSKNLWDFEQWQPHVVVINIGQNDKWTWKGRPAEDFISAYTELLKVNHERYPDAYLVATLGGMDTNEPNSPWPDWVKKAVKGFQDETGYDRVATFFFTYTGEKGHPSPELAKAMAEELADFIESLPDALPPRKQ